MSRSGRILYLGAIALLFVTACAQSQSNQSSTSPIVIGFDLAKTGISAAYDVQPARGAQLAIKQINDSGGVLGRKLQFNWEDTKGDPAQGGTNATSLIANHAAALLVSCDLDLGGPAAVRGNASRVPTFSCAADPHFGDTKTLGPYAFQMNATTNNAGAVMAEWADSKGWRSTYVLGDTALQYSKSL